MTNAQNIRTIVAQLMREKQEFEPALEKAEEQYRLAFKRVLVWEEAYMASGKAEEVGQTLDEVYDEYSEADKAMREAKVKVQSIKEALEALYKAVEAIEWLGL